MLHTIEKPHVDHDHAPTRETFANLLPVKAKALSFSAKGGCREITDTDACGASFALLADPKCYRKVLFL